MSEESYLVSARKYRPQLFGDLIAQTHVSETLKNAVRLDRLAHAYLFTGPRGVGKTTAARVLAKAINCTTPLDQRSDAAEPCRSCESCISFEQGRNLNIIEIDAASNNKVDDARDLRETVRIPPQGARMKVYIIDEVHMLTNQAFNALLKTLEEPPAHALFIFATTEPHKVPATIQSRCQRFDFRRIATMEIVGYLKTICESESVRIDDASLLLIGRKGDGALRDALSVFDQAISLCGETITYEELVRALGVVDGDLFFSVTEAVHAGNVGEMFHIVERIVRAGYDLQEFLDGLEEHLRHLLVISTVGASGLLDVTPDDASRLDREASRFPESTLLRLIHIVSETSDRLRLARQPRLRLEMALVKMASLPASVDIRLALDKLDALEQAVRGTDLSQLSFRPELSSIPEKVSGQGSQAPVVRPTSQEDSIKKHVAEPRVEPRSPRTGPDSGSIAGSVTIPSDKPEEGSEAKPEARPEIRAEAKPEARPEIRAEAKPESESVAISSALDFGEPALKVTRTVRHDKPEDSVSGLQLPGNSRVIQSRPASSDTAVGVLEMEIDNIEGDERSGQPALETAENAWSAVITETMDKQIGLGSLLRHSRVITIMDGHVEIAVPDDFHKRMLINEKQGLSSLLSAKLGSPVGDLHFAIMPDLFESASPGSAVEFDSRAFLLRKCEENPAIKSLVERFGGEIVW